MTGRPRSTGWTPVSLESGEEAVERIEQVLSETKAEIERSNKLVRQIRASRKKIKKKRALSEDEESS